MHKERCSPSLSYLKGIPSILLLSLKYYQENCVWYGIIILSIYMVKENSSVSPWFTLSPYQSLAILWVYLEPFLMIVL